MKAKLSDYNVVVEHGDGIIVYSQITGSLIVLTASQYEQYKLIKQGKGANRAFVEQLRELGIVQRKGLDELHWMQSVWNRKKDAGIDKGLTIAPTDKCNLGCVYCYEDKAQWVAMSEENQEKLKIFIKTFVDSSPTKNFHVTWFGGEPTLHLQCVESISGFVKGLCEERGIHFGQMMVTNGTTLTGPVIERLKACGILNLQITIDGFKEDHDKSRPFLSQMKLDEMNEHQIQQRRKIEPGFGVFLNVLDQEPCIKKDRSSFDAIMNNLKLLHKHGFVVSLRCNLTDVNKHRYAEFHRMIHDMGLATRSEKGGWVAVYPARVFDYGAGISKEEFSDIEMGAKILNQDGDGCTQNTAMLQPFSGESCMANKRFSLGVSQSGVLTKCWHHITNETFAIGTLDDLHIAENGYVDDYSPFNDKECRQCRVLPSCMGGCKQQNEFYEAGLEGKKLIGCDNTRWNIRKRVVALYEATKAGRPK